MKRLLMVLALAGFAVACGDDDGDDSKPDGSTQDAGRDGGVPGMDGGGDAGHDGGADGGGDASMAKVLMTGIACATANTCGGSAPICSSKLFSADAGPSIPGNYCTASCTATNQCGDGICLLGPYISIPALQAQFGPSAYCHQPCTSVGTATGCRQGFACGSVRSLAIAADAGAAALSMLDQLPVADTGFCVPIPNYLPPDAGPGDAGPGDAGVSDSGATDAGLADGGDAS